MTKFFRPHYSGNVGSRLAVRARAIARSRYSAASSASARCLVSPGADARGLHLADISAPRFAERKVMERSTASIRLSARELYYHAPFLDFLSDELSEIGGRTRNYGAG